MQLSNLYRKQWGVTLVELLVALAVTGIILAGVVQVMVDNRQKFRINNELAFIQENARFVLDELGYELRMAGFSGCGASAKVANVVNTTDPLLSSLGIEGWDGSEATANFPSAISADLWNSNAASAPDVVLVKRVDSDVQYALTSSTTTSGGAVDINVDQTHDVDKGAIMVIQSPDCSQIAVFQNTQQNAGDNATEFESGAGIVTPGNCSATFLGGDGDCSSPSGILTNNIFPVGSSVVEFISHTYYIAPSSIDAAIPSLYREAIATDEASGVLGTQAEELLIGVENMQLMYGIDTDTDADGIADRYQDADTVTDWGRAVAVRIDLLLRSLEGVWLEDTTFTFDGVSYTDRLLRQQVSTTIQLRNLALLK